MAFYSKFKQYSNILFKSNNLLISLPILFIHLILLLVPNYMGGDSYLNLF